MNKSVYIVIVCKTFVNLDLVFYNATEKIVRYACIEYSSIDVCENIDVVVVFHIFLFFVAQEGGARPEAGMTSSTYKTDFLEEMFLFLSKKIMGACVGSVFYKFAT